MEKLLRFNKSVENSLKAGKEMQNRKRIFWVMIKSHIVRSILIMYVCIYKKKMQNSILSEP